MNRAERQALKTLRLSIEGESQNHTVEGGLFDHWLAAIDELLGEERRPRTLAEAFAEMAPVAWFDVVKRAAKS